MTGSTLRTAARAHYVDGRSGRVVRWHDGRAGGLWLKRGVSWTADSINSSDAALRRAVLRPPCGACSFKKICAAGRSYCARWWAGEPLNPEVIERVRAAWGLTIRDGFGQTETTAQIGNPPGQLLKPGSIVGRLDDVFKSSGYRISPFELESVLIEHPAVAEAAVVPSRDPLRLLRCPRALSC